MRYRLGDFDPQPGSDIFTIDPMDDELDGEMSGEFGGMVEAVKDALDSDLDSAVSGGDPRLTDVLQSLPVGDDDWCAASIVHQTLRDLNADGVGFRLLACEHQPGWAGFLSIAATLPDRFAVIGADDIHQAGFALLRTENTTRVWPRLFRVICENGAIVPSWIGETSVAGRSHLGALVRSSLSQPVFDRAIAALTEAAGREADDPLPIRDEFYRGLERLFLARELEKIWERMLDRWDDEGDGSAYGLLNALTAEARHAKDFRARLALEGFAGRLARLNPRTPHGSGSASADLVTA